MNYKGEKMKLLIIGGNGTIGRKVCAHFSGKHELIIAGRTSGDVTVDIADSKSIRAMFKSVGIIDAVLCIAGEAAVYGYKKGMVVFFIAYAYLASVTVVGQFQLSQVHSQGTSLDNDGSVL